MLEPLYESIALLSLMFSLSYFIRDCYLCVCVYLYVFVCSESTHNTYILSMKIISDPPHESERTPGRKKQSKGIEVLSISLLTRVKCIEESWQAQNAI